MINKHQNEYEDKIYRPRRKLWFFVSVIILVIISLILVLVVRSFINKPKKQQGQELKRSISSMEDRFKNSDISLNINSEKGWDVSIQNGNYQISSLSNSCKLNTKLTKSVKDSIISGQTLDSSVNSELKSINDASADRSLVINETSSVFLNSNKGDIEFLQKDADYQSSANGQHALKVYGQWIGEHQLVLIIDCKKEDWKYAKDINEDLLRSLEIKIN